MNRSACLSFYLLLLCDLFCGAAAAQKPDLACECHADVSPQAEFRYESKNTPLPRIQPEETTVKEILDWVPLYFPGFPSNTPRQDRELRLFHVSRAFLQAVWVNRYDCDFHLEVSHEEKKDSPRIIVEMTKDFCPERKQLQSQLAAKGVILNDKFQELTPSLTVEMVGLAFQDKSEPRGSAHVDALWELHPAIVKLTSSSPPSGKQ